MMIRDKAMPDKRQIGKNQRSGLAAHNNNQQKAAKGSPLPNPTPCNVMPTNEHANFAHSAFTKGPVTAYLDYLSATMVYLY